jgi:hypothetical protein
MLPYVSPVNPIAPKAHFPRNPSPYTTTKPANISCSHLSRLAATVPPPAPSLARCWCPALSVVCCWCPALSLACCLVPCSCSLSCVSLGALLLLPPSRAAWWPPPPASSAGRHLLLPPSRYPRRFIWQAKAELRAGNFIQKPIQRVQILYKPLYRQNNHYSGKSTTSRLTYRLVSKSVHCRLNLIC